MHNKIFGSPFKKTLQLYLGKEKPDELQANASRKGNRSSLSNNAASRRGLHETIIGLRQIEGHEVCCLLDAGNRHHGFAEVGLRLAGRMWRGGSLLLRHVTPLAWIHVVYFSSGTYILKNAGKEIRAVRSPCIPRHLEADAAQSTEVREASERPSMSDLFTYLKRFDRSPTAGHREPACSPSRYR